MAQIIGNPSRDTSGHMLAEGPGGVGQVLILTGSGDPNSITDSADLNPGIQSAAVGSLFLRQDAPDSTHALYVKTAAGTWTPK